MSDPPHGKIISLSYTKITSLSTDQTIKKRLTMAQVTVGPLPLATMDPKSRNPFDGESTLQDTSASSELPSNPPFVFPMQAESPGTAGPGRNTSLRQEGGGSGTRLANRARPQRLSINNALPSFEFNPSGMESTSSSADSAQSPSRTLPTTSHPSGHRRNNSEFIGGDGRSNGPGLMSSSPTKSEGALPTPQTSRLGPPSGRRGHAHRRSGAISSHDISVIMKPATDKSISHVGGTPSTPSDETSRAQIMTDDDESILQPNLSLMSPGLNTSPRRRESAPLLDRSRARVGFSDTVEFIPRPLSTISSETSSSLSTVRAGHSVTGSISSIVSGGTSSPPSARSARIPPHPTFESNTIQIRSRSSDSVQHEPKKGQTVGQYSRSLARPSSASADLSLFRSTDSLKTRADHSNVLSGNDLIFEAPASNPVRLEKPGLWNFDLSHKGSHLGSKSGRRPVQSTSPLSRPRSSPEPKISKRQRKVKSWAGSLLSRTLRHEPDLQTASINWAPSTAVGNLATSGDFSVEDVNLDEDTSYVEYNPIQSTSYPSPVRLGTVQRKPRQLGSFDDFDLSSGVLDLDAALNPLSDPGLTSDSDESATSGFTTAKRRMHSSGATGGFLGPGMHYHRRTESAPELVPFRPHMGLQRLGSNPTMADVFEEEEEEMPLSRVQGSSPAKTKELHPSADASGLGVLVVDADHTGNTTSMRRSSKQYNAEIDGSEQVAAIIQPQRSASSLGSHAIDDNIAAIEVVSPEEEPRFSMITKSSDESTITPKLSIDPIGIRPASAPIDFAIPNMSSRPRAPDESSSAVSSPGFSEISFDGPRVSTATSSITDRGTLSSFRAEQAHEFRASVDDVPSLTSSASTRSAHPAGLYNSTGNRRSADRSSSLSAAVPQTRPPLSSNPGSSGKRSSLASFSRLMVGSSGERSKLSIEHRAQSDTSERTQKKKGNRISRLMHFWKSKERSTSSGHD